LVTPNTPGVPSLSSPSSNALVTDLTPRFDWGTSSLPSGTFFDHYQLQVAIDNAFASPVIDVSVSDRLTSEYTPLTDLLPNTMYYWRVRAFNTLGQYASWSSVGYFREAMLPPVLVTPGDGTTQSTLRPSFDWEDVPGAGSYTIQISRYSSMSLPSINNSVAGHAYTSSKDLTKNRTLYWRVRANGANGPSPWSAVRTFVILIP
jgi:hypothetical protein